MKNLQFTKEADEQLKKLDPKDKKEIVHKTGELIENPELGKPLRYQWKDYRSLRIGVFRVIYFIRGENVMVTKIGHRKDVYD